MEPPQQESTFEFELLQWRCRHATAGTSDEVFEAEGEFCYASLSITNTGEALASLNASCQFMIVGKERYTPIAEVMALDELADAGFGEEIAPGGRVENSALYYDVPKGSDPDALELHEGCDSPGFRLPLTPALRGD